MGGGEGEGGVRQQQQKKLGLFRVEVAWGSVLFYPLCVLIFFSSFVVVVVLPSECWQSTLFQIFLSYQIDYFISVQFHCQLKHRVQ